jgi:DNA-binding transcriptional LysR family regulator
MSPERTPASVAPARLLRLRRPADLTDVPILWREAGSGTRAVVERALRAALKGRRETALDWELGSTEAIKVAAAESLGVAFLSRWSLTLELETGRLRVLDLGLSIPRRFSWVLSSRAPQGIAGRFHRFAMEEAPALAPR